MLQNLLIFSLCIVAITANGDFTILSSPKSLSFKGTEPLQSEYIGDVIYAALGNSVAGAAKWSGLLINDPFEMPKKVVVISYNGAETSKVAGTGKTYKIQGNSVSRSLNGVSAQLEADNEPVCVINFDELDEGIESFKNIVGNVKVTPVTNTKNLNSERHSGVKEHLEAVAYLRSLAENLGSLEKSCELLVIRLSVDSVAKAYGEKSEAMTEAMDLFASATKLFTLAAQKSSNSDTLIIAVVDKADQLRSKREAVGPDPKNPYNLAEYYSEDYPVIFNIILWFMVTFGFALLAICYAIGSMDPGRDSIIYRMTSTRMKKDN